MHSLFLKIFLWFWAAMALIGVVFAAVEATTGQEEWAQRWRGITSDAFGFYAQTAVENFEEGGSREVAGYLALLEQRTHVHACLFDERGREIARPDQFGRDQTQSIKPRFWTVSARELEQIVARARNSDQVEFYPLGAITLVARVVGGSRGQSFVLVGEVPSPRLGFRDIELSVHVLRFMAVLVAATVLCWGLARHLTEPIIAVRAAAQRLAIGDLKARADPRVGRRQDELGDLAQDFDRMAARIEALLDAQSQLMQAQQRLLADVSHELRSPLARLSVALDIARDSVDEISDSNAGSDAFHNALNDLTEAHERVERETGRLDEMITRLLTLSRLESGVQETGTTLIQLASLVRAIVADADFEAQSEGRAVQLTVCQECTTRGTPDLLRSAIENVVRNAVRHTPENTTVEVTLEQHGEQAIIAVRDYGPGVPEDALQDIFRPFYRVSQARERISGGEGLGLAITARAVQLHGGDVRAENAPDGGLIVQIRLPLLLEQPAASQTMASAEMA